MTQNVKIGWAMAPVILSRRGGFFTHSVIYLPYDVRFADRHNGGHSATMVEMFDGVQSRRSVAKVI